VKQRPAWQGSGAQLFPQAVMIEELKRKLGDEVEKLTHELNVVLPNEIRKAVELGDLRENSEYKAALERQQFVQARLSQLRQRLSKLSSIDMSQIPLDKVGLGSRVVVVCQDTRVQETYHLVFGDSENFDEGHVTMSSPIGRALVGKGVGDDVLFKLPARTRKLRILELKTIHDTSA
jgi:transcription elongation factor GreA